MPFLCDECPSQAREADIAGRRAETKEFAAPGACRVTGGIAAAHGAVLGDATGGPAGVPRDRARRLKAVAVRHGTIVPTTCSSCRSGRGAGLPVVGALVPSPTDARTSGEANATARRSPHCARTTAFV